MCEITEDLFFNDPYQIHARNSYPADLENDVAALRDDAQLKIAVASSSTAFSRTPKPCCTETFTAVRFCGRRQPEGHRR